jgi:hypothetical protein
MYAQCHLAAGRAIMGSSFLTRPAEERQNLLVDMVLEQTGGDWSSSPVGLVVNPLGGSEGRLILAEERIKDVGQAFMATLQHAAVLVSAAARGEPGVQCR